MTVIWIITAYLALLLFLGLFSSRLFKGTSQDYMLASHSIGPFMLLMSLFGTTMTAFALVGSTGEAFAEGAGVYGMLASSSGIIHSLCFFVLGVKLWSLGKKYGYTTQIQYFRDRLQSDKIGILLFPILVGMVVPYLLIGVMASGTVINGITEGAFQNYFAAYDYGVPPWLGALVISIVVLIYVFFGGMRGTAWANTFQTIVFMILGVVTIYVIADKLGGAQHATELVLKKNPSKLMREVAPEDQKRYEETYARWETLAEYNFLARKSGGELLTPEQIEAAYAGFKPRMPNWERVAKSIYSQQNGLLQLTPEEQNEARFQQDDRTIPEIKPAGWDTEVLSHHDLREFPRVAGAEARAFTIYAANIGHPEQLLDSSKPELGKKWSRKKAVGVYKAVNWAPDEPHRMNEWLFLTYLFIPLSVGMFPHIFQHWLTARSAASFKLPVVAHPLFIAILWAPCIMIGIWATSAETATGANMFPPHFNPNAVLAVLVKSLTSPVLAGLLAAGVLAAIMSSLDSQFLCVGTMFTEDIVVHYAGKNRFSEKQIILLARSFIVAIVLLTFALSLFEPRRVFTLGVWTFSGFASLFPLVFAALYWKGLTKAGAYAAVITCAASWFYFFSDSNWGDNEKYAVILPIGDGIPTMPVLTMIVATTLAMIVVSLVTPKPPAEVLRKFFPESR